MLAWQIVHTQNFTLDERRFEKKQNQIKLLIDQGSYCKEQCLLTHSQYQKLSQAASEDKS